MMRRDDIFGNPPVALLLAIVELLREALSSENTPFAKLMRSGQPDLSATSDQSESMHVSAVNTHDYHGHRKLNRDEQAELVALYEAGTSMIELSRKFECHRQTVARQLKGVCQSDESVRKTLIAIHPNPPPADYYFIGTRPEMGQKLCRHMVTTKRINVQLEGDQGEPSRATHRHAPRRHHRVRRTTRSKLAVIRVRGDEEKLARAVGDRQEGSY